MKTQRVGMRTSHNLGDALSSPRGPGLLPGRPGQGCCLGARARGAPWEPGPGANVGFSVISCVELREQLRECRLTGYAPGGSQKRVKGEFQVEGLIRASQRNGGGWDRKGSSEVAVRNGSRP